MESSANAGAAIAAGATAVAALIAATGKREKSG